MTDAARKLILGIETSCDETAASVVEWSDGSVRTLSNAVASQHELHAEYKGVVPEIASRAHAERITPIIRRACDEASVGLADLTAIAAGVRPGLIGSLLVGVSASKALAWSLGVPLIGVDHVRAHLYACLLDQPRPAFPALGLVISGGHTSLYRMGSPTDLTRLGGTIDDAIGEAYDKAATILGIDYPGGPNLDKRAQDAEARGVAIVDELPVSRLGRESLDFSFSGLKTAVLYAFRGVPGRRESASAADATFESDEAREHRMDELCLAFQHAAVRALTLKVERALDAKPDCGALLVGGGVSANSRVRTELARLGEDRGVEVRMPPMALCVDNAAMIAGLGAEQLASSNWQGESLSEVRAEPTTRA